MSKLTLLHPEWPKLHRVLAVQCAKRVEDKVLLLTYLIFCEKKTHLRISTNFLSEIHYHIRKTIYLRSLDHRKPLYLLFSDHDLCNLICLSIENSFLYKVTCTGTGGKNENDRVAWNCTH